MLRSFPFWELIMEASMDDQHCNCDDNQLFKVDPCLGHILVDFLDRVRRYGTQPGNDVYEVWMKLFALSVTDHSKLVYGYY